MRHTLEAIFRHPLELLMLIVMLPVIGVAIMYFMVPRTYQSTASLWALQRYFVISASGLESDLTATEAQTQATALNELLQTRSFDDAVVKGIDLASTLNLGSTTLNNPQELETALFNEISKHVVASSTGTYLYEVTYANPNPQIAQQIVAAVIANFGTLGLGLSRTEAENLLGGFQTQLATAQNNLNVAVEAETQYARAHSNQTPSQLLGSDSQYALLDTQKTQAQTIVQNLENTINGIEDLINTSGAQSSTLFKVIDQPQMEFTPLSRTKNYLLGGGIGLAIALLTFVIYLLIVVRRDQGVYSAYDLQDFVAFPIILQLPKLTTSTVAMLTSDNMRGQALLSEGKGSSNGHIIR